MLMDSESGLSSSDEILFCFRQKCPFIGFLNNEITGEFSAETNTTDFWDIKTEHFRSIHTIQPYALIFVRTGSYFLFFKTNQWHFNKGCQIGGARSRLNSNFVAIFVWKSEDAIFLWLKCSPRPSEHFPRSK